MFNIYGYFMCNLNVKFLIVFECKMVILFDFRSFRLYKIVVLVVRLLLVLMVLCVFVNRFFVFFIKFSFNRRLFRWERSLFNMKEININVYVYSKIYFYVFLCENMFYIYLFIFFLLFKCFKII